MEANKMGPKWKTRIVEGEFPNRDFDIEFWQEQGDESNFPSGLGNGGVGGGSQTW
jgi:hypothetical protein